MKSMIRTLSRDERGASLMMVAVSMVAFIGMAALAIDVGMLYEAKGQAQNAADSGALAGAGSLIQAPNDEPLARSTATDFAQKHEIIKQQVAIDSAADVQVDLANMRVTVTARRIGARGNPVPTFFAKILGWDFVDIQATATAQVERASAAACLKPWIIPDAYDDLTPPYGEYNAGDYYDQGVTSYGTNHRNNNYDWGMQMVLKQGSPGSSPAPGQFYPIDLPLPSGPITGGDRYRENIAQCNSLIVNIGDWVWTENGNMVGPTTQGVRDLVALDPGATFDSTLGVTNSAFPPGGSPRLVRVPLYNPATPPTSGRQQIQVVNIVGFFIEGMQGNGNVTGRLMPTTGTGSPNPGTMLYTVRLVR